MLEIAIAIAIAVATVWRPETRTVGFLLGLVIWETVWALSMTVADARGLRAALVTGAVLALLAPAKLGLGARTNSEGDLDREILEWGRTSRRLEPQQWLDAFRDARPRILGDHRRLVAARLSAWAAARGDGLAAVASSTPSRYYELCAAHWLKSAQLRRVIGAKRWVDAWDEEVALRCFFEFGRHLIPDEARYEFSVVSLGTWMTDLEALEADLRCAPFREPALMAARETLIALLALEARIASGERGEEIMRAHEQRLDDMEESWLRTRNRIQKLSS